LASWLERMRVELRLAFRDRRTVTFTVLLPFILLLALASLIHAQKLKDNVSFAQYLTAGMIASGLVYGAFQSLAIAIPDERSNGTLKRLYGTPLPRSAYFAGKVGCAVVLYIVQMVLMVGLGSIAFHIHIPTSWFSIVTFLWLSVLGLISFTALGIAFSSLAKTGQAAAAIATPLVLVLQFSSGVFFVFTKEPTWMRDVGSFFPLRWLAQGMRSVFLPASFGHYELGGGYQLEMVAAILAIWSVVGLFLCWRTFKWLPIGEN
jgi:ABC-2 type transport system permease protein